MLARLHRAGEPTAVHVPNAVEESVRDLCRARTDGLVPNESTSRGGCGNERPPGNGKFIPATSRTLQHCLSVCDRFSRICGEAGSIRSFRVPSRQ